MTAKRKKNPSKWGYVRYLWDNFRHMNIQIKGMPEGEERERDIENLFEQIMTENIPNLVKEIDT